MRKVIIFFNDNKPYVIKVGLHLDSIRLQYPGGDLADLKIMSAKTDDRAAREEYYVASDRKLNDEEVIEAVKTLL